MFRIGGSAGEGVTSGLAPRQGYSHPGHVVQNDPRKLSDIRDMSLDELRALSGEMSYKPRGTNVYDFLTEFGLNIASTPPAGNIFATAATAAKEPYQRFLTRKGEAGIQEYASEADMFKTLVGAQAKILGSEGGSKIFSKQQAASAMSDLLGEWQDLRDKQDEMDPGEFKDQKAIIWGQIMQYQKENPAISSLFKDRDFAESVKSKIKSKLKKSTKMITAPDPENPGQTIEMTEGQYYKENQDELMLEVGRRYIEYYNDMMTLGGGASLKSGGRAGYVGGGASGVVSTGGYDTSGRPGYDMEGGFETAKITGMPEELKSIGYEELRARLPREVSDEVVHLLASSAEALEDFATIQTEQDVANFNKKYSVNLVLPAEG
jgi:hypothetical protein